MEDLAIYRLMLGYGEDLPRQFLEENGAQPFTSPTQLEDRCFAYLLPDKVKRSSIARRRLTNRPLPQFAIANGPLTFQTFDRATGDYTHPGKLHLVHGGFDLYNLNTGFVGSATSEEKPFVVHDDYAFVVPERDALTKWWAQDLETYMHERTLN